MIIMYVIHCLTSQGPAQHRVDGVGDEDGVVTRFGPVVRLVAERGAVGRQGPEVGRQSDHSSEGEVTTHGQRVPAQFI